MGGKASRQKGDRAERALVNMLRAAGLTANRVPLSGAMQNKFGGCDLIIEMFEREHRVESKHHANGFKTLYAWLDPKPPVQNVDMLILRCDHGEPLVVMRLRDLVEMATKKKPGR
jgi:hypothetical protein